MKVTISVNGKFHAFELAKQLEKRRFLERLITSYPWFKMSKEGLPKEKVASLPMKEIMQQALNFIPFLKNKISPEWYSASLFDKQASRYVRPCDIFVGWSGSSLHSLRKAKSLGAITILERCSSHIVYQKDILKEEYELWGLKPALPSSRIVEKELDEYRQSDYIAIPSQFAKQTFLDKGVPEDKLIHIPYGVDIDIFRPISKNDNIFRAIYVGAMTIRKGVHYLLRAVSELNLKNFELWLIGSLCDEIKPFFKKYRDIFKYFGHIDYRRLYRFYSQGSVFILPSIEDGLAHVILQAMACGLPVICTTNSGGQDVIRDTKEGFIVPARNAEVLRDKILYLYERPNLLEEMNKLAYKRVTKNFTWDDYGEKIIDVYLNLLK
jgi:glycosyltransferase involved in cell wall biosynthesis